MHYYPYPFKDSSSDTRAAVEQEHHEADSRIDRLICLFVGLLCVGMLSAIA